MESEYLLNVAKNSLSWQHHQTGGTCFSRVKSLSTENRKSIFLAIFGLIILVYLLNPTVVNTRCEVTLTAMLC